MRMPTPTDVSFLNQRRAALSRHREQIGIDYIEVKTVSPESWELRLHFVPAAENVDKKVVPQDITRDNIIITGLQVSPEPTFGWKMSPPARLKVSD